MYSGAVFDADLAQVFGGIPWIARHAEQSAFVSVVVLASYLSLILGKLIPKRIALARAEALAGVVAIPMDGSWLVDGRLGIPEVEHLLERNDLAHGDDYYTVGGFVL